MSQPDDPCSVIRIAIAFAALKHKPRDQSTTSYLLDLQSRFPVATKDNNDREWRTYALELEKQVETLKAQRDADQDLFSNTRADASQAASTPDAPPPKKRSRRNPTKDRRDPERSWDQSRADWSRFLSSQYPSSPSLVAAYASLKGALAAPNADLMSYSSRLTDAILRALDTIHVFLFSPLNPGPVLQAPSAFGAVLQLKPEHINSTRIALTSPFLMYVLRTALHTLVRTAQESTAKSKSRRQRSHTVTLASVDAYAYVDKVFDYLLEYVLFALLRALAPLCSARLAPLLSVPLKKDIAKDRAGRSSTGKGKGKEKEKSKDKDKDKGKGKGAGPASAAVGPPKNTDVRTDVFALIGTSLEALDALPPFIGPGGEGGSIADSARDRLGLETIRELEALYAAPRPLPPSSCSASSQPSTTLSEPPPPPTPTPTPLSAPSQPQSQPQSEAQQHSVPESRAKRLERLTGTRTERVQALATRDAGWFLTSTLNLCVTSALPARGHNRSGNSGGISLRDALLDRIGRLVRSVPLSGGILDPGSPGQQSNGDMVGGRASDSKLAVDPVCQNMLLAICERALGQLASP